jgi:hypothetical protein
MVTPFWVVLLYGGFYGSQHTEAAEMIRRLL